MKPENRRALSFLLWVVWITIGVAGCGGVSQPNSTTTQGSGNTKPSTSNEALYLSSRGGIAGFAVNSADGSLSSLPGSPFPAPFNIMALVASPSSRVILADGFPRNGPGGIWVLRVNSQGGLQADPKPAVSSIGSIEQSVVFHPSGKLVYLSSFIGPMVISAHRFDETAGAIASEVSSQVQLPIDCSDPAFCSQSVTMAGYSTNNGDDHLWVEIGDCGFHIDCEVTLAPMPVSNGGATIGPPSGLAIQPNANEVHAFSIFNDGAVTVEQMTCCSVTALGSYVLRNGQVLTMKGCPIADPACADAESIAMHPNQKLAIVGGFDGRLFAAMRDAAGNLANPIPTGFSIGTIADRLVWDPSGKFLYVMSSQANQIFGFSVDANSGVLQAIPGSPWTVPGTSPADGVSAPIAIPLPAPH